MNYLIKTITYNTFVPTLNILIIVPDKILMTFQTWHLKYQFWVIRGARGHVEEEDAEALSKVNETG